MGLFGRNKMSKAAGEWAATAMACMVFADGSASETEVAAARGQLEANPILKNTLGSKNAEALFNETIGAIQQIPSAMLPTYEGRLAGLIEKIDAQDDRNFALTTVIAVAMADRSLTAGEYSLLVRFRDSLGATIPIPTPEQEMPTEFREALGETVEQVDAPQSIACSSCAAETQHYQDYGHWCGSCQQYTQVETAAGNPSGDTTDPDTVSCSKCTNATQFYEGYGHWCAACQVYT